MHIIDSVSGGYAAKYMVDFNPNLGSNTYGVLLMIKGI
jgi:hypothetical protein